MAVCLPTITFIYLYIVVFEEFWYVYGIHDYFLDKYDIPVFFVIVGIYDRNGGII